VQEAAHNAAVELDADVLLLNASMAVGLERQLRSTLSARAAKRGAVVVVLVTPGGLADTAYRVAAALQHAYDRVIVCVPGWCKSAGTLLAIGASELIIGPEGELGPLDVQIAKKDDLGGDRDSGLILNEALERLRDEAFGFFENFMIRIIAQSQNNVTFRTAATIAADMTIGLMSPVFDKVDPIRIGADARAMNIGRDYAVRLNLKANNLVSVEALNMLLNGYPSHSFVIDQSEAARLFTNVKPLDGQLGVLVGALGELATTPRSEPIVCYLDGVSDGEADEQGEPEAGLPHTPEPNEDHGSASYTPEEL
jgi:hypothetical protein